MGSVSTSLFGTSDKSDTVDYNYVGSVNKDNTITSDFVLKVATAVASEYKRRTTESWAVPATFANINSKVIHNHLNTLKTRLEVAPKTPAQRGHASRTQVPTPDNQVGNGGPDVGATPETYTFPVPTSYTSGFSGIDANGIIYAQDINSLISKLQGAGQVCICNCNYCTCNCNYCSCNCNYACTCNCNYSDIRLKTNIELIGREAGLNIYSWNYLGNTVKRFSGVIAQELLGTNYKSALYIDSKGHYYVDYSQLPITFKEV
jgi:hypothetical protein